MLKMKSILTVSVNGRDYEFSCPPDSPLNDAVNASDQVNAFLLGRAEQAKKAQEAQEMPPMPEMPPVTEEVPQG
jgi:hypothetical protein